MILLIFCSVLIITSMALLLWLQKAEKQLSAALELSTILSEDNGKLRLELHKEKYPTEMEN